MPPFSGMPRMISLRLLVAAGAGMASVAAAHLTGLLALAALDGGRELPALVAYGMPVLSSFLPPVLTVQLGVCPKGRWRGTTASLGAALGTTCGILAAAHLKEPMAWLFVSTTVGAFVGTLAWLPWRGSRGANAGEAR